MSSKNKMRVLISNDGPFAHYYIREAIGRVFASMNHSVVLWDIDKKPVYDAFDEFQPDFFIGQTYNINKGIIQCLKERPNCKVIMKGSDYGNISDEIDREKFPVLIANEKEIENVKRLREEVGKPDLIYVHYKQSRLKQTHNHWQEKIGVPVVSLQNAADVFAFTGGKSRPEFECDFCFVGGRWGYKARTLDKWLMPLLSRNHHYRAKIFGNQPWGVPQYCGFLENADVKDLFSSARVGINLSEPHSQYYGYDVIERPYKLLSSKCCVLSDYVEDLASEFPNEIHHAHSPEEFKEKLDWLLANEKERVDSAEAGYKKVIERHTYFHRMSLIFKALGMDGEDKKCFDTFQRIKKDLKL